MNIYLAARYGRRLELCTYADQLIAMGHTVTSRWLRGSHDAADGDVSRWKDFASEDLADIHRSNVLIVFTEPPGEAVPSAERGSRHVELGMAIERNLYVVVVGPRENIFCRLPEIMHYETFAGLVAAWKPEGVFA